MEQRLQCCTCCLVVGCSQGVLTVHFTVKSLADQRPSASGAQVLLSWCTWKLLPGSTAWLSSETFSEQLHS